MPYNGFQDNFFSYQKNHAFHSEVNQDFRLPTSGPFKFRPKNWSLLIMFEDQEIGTVEYNQYEVKIKTADFVPQEAHDLIRGTIPELKELFLRAGQVRTERMRLLREEAVTIMGPVNTRKKVVRLDVDFRDTLALAFYGDYLKSASVEGVAVSEVKITKQGYFKADFVLTGRNGLYTPLFYLKAAGNRWETGSNLDDTEGTRTEMVEAMMSRMLERRNRIIRDEDLLNAIARFPQASNETKIRFRNESSGVRYPYSFIYAKHRPENLKSNYQSPFVEEVALHDFVVKLDQHKNMTMFFKNEVIGTDYPSQRGWLPGFTPRDGFWTDMMAEMAKVHPEHISYGYKGLIEKRTKTPDQNAITEAMAAYQDPGEEGLVRF